MASSVSAIGFLTSIGAAPETDRYTFAAPKSQQSQQQQVNSTTATNDGVTLTLNAPIHLLQQEGQTPTQISSSIPEPIATVDEYLQVPVTTGTTATAAAPTATTTTNGTTTTQASSPETTAGIATANLATAGEATASPAPAGAATASPEDAGTTSETTDSSSSRSASSATSSSSSATTPKYGSSTSCGFGFPVAAKTDASATVKAGAASGQTINLLT